MNTELILVADCSGSMTNMRAESEGAVRKLVHEQKSIPGDVRFTLVRFDTDVVTPIAARPLDKVKNEEIQLPCNGLTALYDAVGITLDGAAERIAKEKWADLVIFAVLTDGAENASNKYDGKRVAEMVQHAEKNGWRFVMLATGMDAWNTAKSVGAQQAVVQSFSAGAVGVRQAYDSLSNTTRSLRSGQSVPPSQ